MIPFFRKKEIKVINSKKAWTPGYNLGGPQGSYYYKDTTNQMVIRYKINSEWGVPMVQSRASYESSTEKFPHIKYPAFDDLPEWDENAGDPEWWGRNG